MERLYFRQLLAGRHFAAADPIAAQMANFVYLIGDRATGECLVVDPTYAVGELLDRAELDGMRITGVLVTHYHPDHVGGSMFGHTLEGVRELLARADVPVHVQRSEAPWVQRTTGLGASELTVHDPGEVVRVGELEVHLLHTPGHTPGSQCFLVGDRLVAGDTLFLDGCGRTDLPGSDPDAMYDSLRRLASLPDDVVLYPGHRYSLASFGSLGAVKQANVVLQPRTREEWRSLFG